MNCRQLTAGDWRKASGAANTAEVIRLVSKVTITPSRRARRRQPKAAGAGRARAMTGWAERPGKGWPSALLERAGRESNTPGRLRRGRCGARVNVEAMASPANAAILPVSAARERRG